MSRQIFRESFAVVVCTLGLVLGLSVSARAADEAKDDIKEFIRTQLIDAKSDLTAGQAQRAKLTARLSAAKEACDDCWVSESGQTTKGQKEVMSQEVHAQYEKQLQAVNVGMRELEIEVKFFEKMVDDKVYSVTKVQQRLGATERDIVAWTETRAKVATEMAALQKIARDIASPTKPAKVMATDGSDAAQNTADLAKLADLTQQSDELAAKLEQAEDEQRLLRRVLAASGAVAAAQ
ncbi:MAG: hypothetical protein AB7P04_02965 [Bacteriovoracia bacterium]